MASVSNVARLQTIRKIFYIYQIEAPRTSIDDNVLNANLRDDSILLVATARVERCIRLGSRFWGFWAFTGNVAGFVTVVAIYYGIEQNH